MSCRKRMADEELNPNSVEILEPLRASTIMATIDGAISQAWSWCRDWYGDRFKTPTYTTMSYTSTDIIADNHVQSSRARKDGGRSLKRQRLPNTNATESKLTVGEHHKGGRGKLDYTGCITEEDFQRRTDDYWAPPELGLFKKGSKNRTTESALDDEEAPPSSREGHSNTSSQPSNSESVSPPVRRPPETKVDYSSLPTFRPPRIDYGPRDKYRTLTKDNGATLEERMNTLLIAPEDEKEPTFLSPSKFVTEKRLRLAKERRAKEKEAAIRAAKELRLIRRSPLKPLIQPLNPEWEDVVNHAQWTKNPNEVLTTSIGGTELLPKDFQRLLGRGAWLNDEIINTYIEWIVDASNRAAAALSDSGESASKVPKFIAHNSFFYENLIKKGPSATQGLMRRKKAPGTSLMEVDSVFVPICKGSHWTLGVVRPVAKTIEYFDSMGGSGAQFTNLMRSWLAFQLGDTYIQEEWKVPRTACAHQTNGYDCGVFVCTNAFCVAMGLDTSCYRECDMTQQRRNIAAVLINRGFTKDFDIAAGGL